MKSIYLLLAVVLVGLGFAPSSAHAEDHAGVRAILIIASPQKGDSDAKLAPYVNTLRRLLPGDLQSFRVAGEGSANLTIPGTTTVQLGRGHRLQLEGEQTEGRNIRLSARWLSGGNELMNQPLRASRGTPTVLGGPSAGGDGEVWAVLIIAQ